VTAAQARIELAVLAIAYFLAQVPILLAAALVLGCMRADNGNNLTGADYL
jgi:hypothetical protein